MRDLTRMAKEIKIKFGFNVLLRNPSANAEDTYRWLKNHNYPEGFQVLCYNCNLPKGVYGVCPHVS